MSFDVKAPPEFTENEIIPISAISHHLYCPRQNALIHVEGVFLDNELTTGGNIGHEYVDEERSIRERGMRKETSLRVYSDRLGLSGIADIVEFPDRGPPFPIDYKHGRIASWENHEAQLCAIALCLEEMLNCSVPAGAIFHIQSKRRHEVAFTPELRATTLKSIDEIREVLTHSLMPRAVFSKKCNKCSLRPHCMPGLYDAAAASRDIFEGASFDG